MCMSGTVNIEILPSAAKHGIGEGDIHAALASFQYDAEFDGEENRHLLLGFDTRARLLEIMYERLDDHNVRVFHAMRCRKAYQALLRR